MEVEIIPVIDLLDGKVVHAQRGQRSHYRPFNSPLCATSKPADIVKALLKLYPFTRLYIADLDAIQKQGNNASIIQEIQALHPQLEIWLDGGFRQEHEVRAWKSMGVACVLGSECLESIEHYLVLKANEPQRTILSLDFDCNGYVGPEELLDAPELWPHQVIVMTLAQVGSNSGPDLEKLNEAVRRASLGGKNFPSIYAAGGIRDVSDMLCLKAIGIAGALVATALHNGSIASEDIAAAHC